MTLYKHLNILDHQEALGAQPQPILSPDDVIAIKIEDNKEVACECVGGELEDGCIYKVKSTRTNKIHAMLNISNPDSAQRQ